MMELVIVVRIPIDGTTHVREVDPQLVCSPSNKLCVIQCECFVAPNVSEVCHCRAAIALGHVRNTFKHHRIMLQELVSQLLELWGSEPIIPTSYERCDFSFLAEGAIIVKEPTVDILGSILHSISISLNNQSVLLSPPPLRDGLVEIHYCRLFEGNY
jgi:hypothetical protein